MAQTAQAPFKHRALSTSGIIEVLNDNTSSEAREASSSGKMRTVLMPDTRSNSRDSFTSMRCRSGTYTRSFSKPALGMFGLPVAAAIEAAEVPKPDAVPTGARSKHRDQPADVLSGLETERKVMDQSGDKIESRSRTDRNGRWKNCCSVQTGVKVYGHIAVEDAGVSLLLSLEHIERLKPVGDRNQCGSRSCSDLPARGVLGFS